METANRFFIGNLGKYLPFQMAINLWKATGNEETFFQSLSLAKQTFTTSYEGASELDKEIGIQKELATQICKMVFQNDIAKLTLEIAEPRMLKVEKDKSVTFAGMLGTIGKYLGYLSLGNHCVVR